MRKAYFEKLQAEWMVIPLVLVAVVPDVAVSKRGWDIPLIANSSATASMMHGFFLPPSRPVNWYS